MPAGTQDIAMQQDVMGAANSEDEETRLMLEGNRQKLVVFAQETYFYSDNMEDDIGKILKSSHGETYTYTTQCIRQSSDGFKVICVSPDKIDTSDESVLVREVFARIADGTLIFVGVYVTPETAADKDLCLKQADKIVESIQPGTRKINASAHVETIVDNLSIKLDKDYVLVEQTGADFSVYYITKIVKLHGSRPLIGIYIGGHPTLMYTQRGIEDSQLTATEDRILNKKVEWLSYKPSPDDEAYSAETVFGLPFSIMQMHIFVDAANEAEFLKIKEMIDTLEVK